MLLLNYDCNKQSKSELEDENFLLLSQLLHLS